MKLQREKSVFSIIFLIAILEGTIIAISALPLDSFLIRSKGTIRYPFIGNPWEIRSLVTFPFSYQYSLIGTGDPNSHEVVLDEIMARFGDPTASGVVNTIDVRFHWTNDGSQVPGASSTSPKIYEGANGGENSFVNVAKAIAAMKARGFRVLLGFSREWSDGTGDIPDAQTWLTNHKDNIIQIAEFAQANGVDFFHMGWEDVLNNEDLQTDATDDIWADILQTVRGVYSGLVAYELNHGPTYAWYGDPNGPAWIDNSRLWENSWWRDLDYLAVSYYAQLMNQGNGDKTRDPGEEHLWDPTVAELEQAWYENYGDQWTGGGGPPWNLTEMLKDLSQHYDKKLVLNGGYPSCDGGAMRPWFPWTDRLDWQEQADIWEAFFRVLGKEDFVLGADLEHFTKPWPPVEPESGWEYQYRSNFAGKYAEAVIKAGFQSVTG